jgi:probable rRNA maturation factor|tara:strand:+ start:629 stop:1096 length:468 start_codon:yes stop_codon:yes gene_type:complete
MIKADVLVSNKAWKKHIKIPSSYVNNKLKKIDKKLNIFRKSHFKFTILLSGSNEIKKLNNKFRKKNKTTDILSFPFYEKKILNILLKKKSNQIYLGDIIINLNKMTLKIKANNFLLIFDKIWIHGLVHLLGYKHKSNRDFSIMTKLENKLINYSK